MPELLDISLQLNSCREVAMRSHGTMARGGGSLKSCERGEGDWEGSLGGSVPVGQHLVGIQMCCHFTLEPLKGGFYRSGFSSPAVFINKRFKYNFVFLCGLRGFRREKLSRSLSGTWFLLPLLEQKGDSGVFPTLNI